MGGGSPKPSPPTAPTPITQTAPRSVVPAPPPRHSCAGRNPRRTPIRHSCAGRNPRRQERAHARTLPPLPQIHPSPLPGGRLGGGWKPQTTAADRTHPNHPNRTPSVIPAPPPRHSRAPHPSFLRRQERAHPRIPHSPFPNSSLPPSRGEVRWGVEAPNHRRRPHPPQPPKPHPLRRSRHPLLRHSRAPSVIPAQAGTTRPPASARARTTAANRTHPNHPPQKGGGTNWQKPQSAQSARTAPTAGASRTAACGAAPWC